MDAPTKVVFKKLVCVVNLEGEGKMGSTTYPHKKTFVLCFSLLLAQRIRVFIVVVINIVENHISIPRKSTYSL